MNNTPPPSPVKVKHKRGAAWSFPESKKLKIEAPSFTAISCDPAVAELKMEDEKNIIHTFHSSGSSSFPPQGVHAKTTAVYDSPHEHSFIIKQLKNTSSILHETNIFNLVYNAKFYAQIQNDCIIMSNICHYRKAIPLSMNPVFGEVAHLKILKAIVIELQRLHELGIIHGDIKADNILIDDNNEIYFIDFGLSNFTSDKTVFCALEEKDYWPPERTNFSKHKKAHPAPSPAQDIFSLGHLIQHFLKPATAIKYASTLDWAARATNPEPSARPQLCDLITILEKACEFLPLNSSSFFPPLFAGTSFPESKELNPVPLLTAG